MQKPRKPCHITTFLKCCPVFLQFALSVFCTNSLFLYSNYINTVNKRTSANSFSFSFCRTCASFFAEANGDCVMCVGGGGWFFTGVFGWPFVAWEWDADADVEASSSSSSRITMLSITAPAIRKEGERTCWGVTNVEASGLHFNYTNTWKHTSYSVITKKTDRLCSNFSYI